MSRRRDEGGATAVLVAIVVVALVVPMAAFAVDLGMQRVARRDMQALADAVALDMGREVDGSTRAVLKNTHAWQEAVGDAVRRNAGSAFGGGAGAVSVATNEADGVATVAGSPLEVEVRMGTLDETGAFHAAGNTDVPTAVRVRAGTTVQYAIATGEGDAARTAVSVAQPGACFSVGSWAARLRTESSPVLGPVLAELGTELKLDVLDYQALAAADVELAHLLGAETDAGTVRELLAGDELITLGEWNAAIASVLPADAPTGVEALLLGVEVGDLMVRVSDVLSVETGGASGMESSLNVLDLLVAGAMTGDGEHGLSLPLTSLDLDPLADVTATAHVTEAPQIGCGLPHRAQASNAQVSVDLEASLLDLDLGLTRVRGVLRSTGVDADGDPYALQVARATGTLTDVRCRPHPGITVDVTGGLVDARLELALEVLVGLVWVEVPVPIRARTETDGTVVLDLPNEAAYDEPGTVGGGLEPLQVDTSGMSVLGALLTPVLEDVVEPVLEDLTEQLLDPLLADLGVAVSGADVYALPTPSCSEPVLRQ